jgi:RNA-binding protein
MLSPAERKSLKARAHKLEPVVIVGAKGLTDEVVKEIDLALKAHELIKVRAPAIDRRERGSLLEQILARTRAERVQEIGKVFVIYRKNDEAG